MHLLLSVHPEHVEAILDGRKRYEFRRRRFRRVGIRMGYIYSTLPVGRVVASFEVGAVAEGTPASLWRRFGRWSGVRRGDFFRYFDGTTKGYAIELIRPRPIEPPIDLRAGKTRISAPQDFRYLERPLHR